MMPHALQHALSRCALPGVVFITGACVLVVEVVAVRVLSPYYGNTIFTVSSIISTVLLALSAGYYLGGKLADKSPSYRVFFLIILASGIGLMTLYAIGLALLPALSLLFSISFGPLVSSAIIFLLPALLLGMLSPYAIVLESKRDAARGLGSVAGVMFFWSTLGSITGSLAAGFLLIPHFGVHHIMLSVGLCLTVLGAGPLLFGTHSGRRLRKVLVLATALTSLSIAGGVKALDMQTQESALFQEDGVYERLHVEDGSYQGRPARFFFQDRSASGAMFLDSDDPTDMVYPYTEYYKLHKLFVPQVREALVLGGGVYSIPKALLATFPEARVTVSEIEPSLPELAQAYFALPDSDRLIHTTRDARAVLRTAPISYDLIFSDVYYSLYSIPGHLVTKEFFTLAKETLAPEGIFIANFIGALTHKNPSLIPSAMRTFRSVFPQSYFFAVEHPASKEVQNIIFVGHRSESTVALGEETLVGHDDPFIRALAAKRIFPERFALASYPLFSDAYVPADYLTAKVLRHAGEALHLLNGEEMLALIDGQVALGPRYPGASGHGPARDLIIKEMETLGAEVFEDTWQEEGMPAGVELTNVVARFDPALTRRVILATHYDTKRYANLDLLHTEEPVPGANDGASGVAVLIELMRAMRFSPVSPGVGIDVIFFDGEEGLPDQGSDYGNWKPLGSTHFAATIAHWYPETLPFGAVVVDMVCDKELAIHKEAASLYHAPASVELFWKVARDVAEEAFPDTVGQEIGDDHTPLNEIGIPSLLLIDSYYPYFHTTRDTPDKCSAENLASVAETLYRYLYAL